MPLNGEVYEITWHMAPIFIILILIWPRLIHIILPGTCIPLIIPSIVIATVNHVKEPKEGAKVTTNPESRHNTPNCNSGLYLQKKA